MLPPVTFRIYMHKKVQINNFVNELLWPFPLNFFSKLYGYTLFSHKHRPLTFRFTFRKVISAFLNVQTSYYIYCFIDSMLIILQVWTICLDVTSCNSNWRIKHSEYGLKESLKTTIFRYFSFLDFWRWFIHLSSDDASTRSFCSRIARKYQNMTKKVCMIKKQSC